MKVVGLWAIHVERLVHARFLYPSREMEREVLRVVSSTFIKKHNNYSFYIKFEVVTYATVDKKRVTSRSRFSRFLQGIQILVSSRMPFHRLDSFLHVKMISILIVLIALKK